MTDKNQTHGVWTREIKMPSWLGGELTERILDYFPFVGVRRSIKRFRDVSIDGVNGILTLASIPFIMFSSGDIGYSIGSHLSYKNLLEGDSFPAPTQAIVEKASREYWESRLNQGLEAYSTEQLRDFVRQGDAQ